MIFKRRPKTAVAYLSTFPPRECGIATFTEDLVNAMDTFLSPNVFSKIIALNTDEEKIDYPDGKVVISINQNNIEEYKGAARMINDDPEISVVSIQHEFGIFGGEDGEYVITFLETVEVPVVITFHTVLPGPNDHIKNTVIRIAEEVSSIIVMTSNSKKILTDDYQIPEEKISIIPHGIHAFPYTTPDEAKRRLGFEGKTVVTTFGFLNKGKGIDYVIDSMPDIVKKFPDVLYLVLGATHPVVLRKEGDGYRKSLEEKVKEFGLENNVKFYNKYFPLAELLDFLKATDIYISPSQNPNQAVSGTLSYALGTGRAVISTAFNQAKEYITENVGYLVGFGGDGDFKEPLRDLIEHPDRMLALGKNAYFKTRHSTWENVAIEYSKIFASLSPVFSSISEEKMIPPLKLDHLFVLTDDFGILQFANLNKPDINFGYTLDDNARALTVVVKSLSRTHDKKSLTRLIDIYLNFIETCQEDSGIFINYIDGKRNIHHELNNNENLEDANGRTMYALAVTATDTNTSKKARTKALLLFEHILKANVRYKSPRANAFKIKSYSQLIQDDIQEIGGVSLVNEITILSNNLISLYDRTHSHDWLWFEEYLTYSNAVLPEALFAAYQVLHSRKYIEVAETTLSFLIRKSFIDGIYVPIGQAGWYRKGGPRNLFDQQPEDATAMVVALGKAYQVTKDKKYLEVKKKTFGWFLGENILKQVVYDRLTGGCYDGVRDTGVNLNEGAESTLSYLIARLSFK